MRKLFLICAALMTTVAAFSQTKIAEGSITYDVSWTLPPQAPPQMASMLPKEMTVYFKGDSSATVAKSQMSNTSTIINPKSEFSRLLLDIPMMGKKFSVRFTPDDLEQMKEKWPKFTATQTADSKTIAGYKAQKYNLSEQTSGQKFDGYFTKDVEIVPNSLTQFFDKSYGFPLEFNTFQNGMGIKAIVKEVKSEKVPAGVFSGSSDYEEITFDQLKGMMGGAGR